MGNKKSRQDLLGYDLSSDTDEEETDKEEDEIEVEKKTIVTKRSKESPEILLTSSPDIMTSSQLYPDVLTPSQPYPDIFAQSQQYPDLLASCNQYPDLVTSSNPYPDLVTSSKHYAENLRMFEATRGKDPDGETDVLDLSR